MSESFLTKWERVIKDMPLHDFRKEHEGHWPPPENQLKIDTCGTCVFFRPPDNRDDWQFLPRHHDGAQGSCGNMEATLGGSISTGRDSRCKHYLPMNRKVAL